MAWKEVEPGFADTTYQGPYPDRLYRYRTLSASNFRERIEQELGRRELFLTAIRDLVDPDEGNIRFEVRGTDNEISRFWIERAAVDFPKSSELWRIAYAAKHLRLTRLNGIAPPRVVGPIWKEIIGKLGRIACFTESPLDPYMWNEYAKWNDGDVSIPSGGICITFASSDWRLLGLAPVKYSDNRPSISISAIKPDSPDFRDAMFVKGTKYAAEREWRIFLNFQPTDLNHPDLSQYSLLAFDEEHIVEVILGPNAPDSIAEVVRDIAARRSTQLAVMRVEEVDGVLASVPID